MRNFVIIAVLCGFVFSCGQAQAGLLSKFRNWANTPWDSCSQGYYGYNGVQNGCPCHRGHFNNGAVTGFTPPIMPYYGNNGVNMNNRFNHLPNGIPTMNSAPMNGYTEFSSNFDTKTGVTIID